LADHNEINMKQLFNNSFLLLKFYLNPQKFAAVLSEKLRLREVFLIYFFFITLHFILMALINSNLDSESKPIFLTDTTIFVINYLASIIKHPFQAFIYSSAIYLIGLIFFNIKPKFSDLFLLVFVAVLIRIFGLFLETIEYVFHLVLNLTISLNFMDLSLGNILYQKDQCSSGFESILFRFNMALLLSIVYMFFLFKNTIYPVKSVWLILLIIASILISFLMLSAVPLILFG